MGSVGSPARLPGVVYKVRDWIENVREIPANSPVSAMVHIPVGGLLMGGGAIGLSSRYESRDNAQPGERTKEDVLEASTALGMLLGAYVLLTGGMQINTPPQQDLVRGLGPIYHLAVGGAAAGVLALPKYKETLEN